MGKPSVAVKTRAQLSVLPARIYSPDGLHARSYTCIVVHLDPITSLLDNATSGSEPMEELTGMSCAVSNVLFRIVGPRC